MVEQRTENPCVPGSIPGPATTLQTKNHPYFADDLDFSGLLQKSLLSPFSSFEACLRVRLASLDSACDFSPVSSLDPPDTFVCPPQSAGWNLAILARGEWGAGQNRPGIA